MQRTLLLVDNDQDVLDSYGKLLRRAGFAVECALTLEAAEQILTRAAVDVLIVDLRMKQEGSAADISGAVFVSRYPTLPALLLTSLESLPHPVSRRVPWARSVGKLEDPENLIAAVHELYERSSTFRRDLALHWVAPASARQLVLLIEPELPGEQLAGRADELSRLLATLFRHSTAARIERLLAHEPGRAALGVTTLAPGGGEEHYLVVCGRPDLVLHESQQYNAHYRRLGGGGVPDRFDVAQRLYSAAVAYRLDGCHPADLFPLAALAPCAPEQRLRAITNRLFGEALHTWHTRDARQQDGEALGDFLFARVSPPDCTAERWRAVIAALCVQLDRYGLARTTYAATGLTLEIDGVRTSFPDPAPRLADPATLRGDDPAAWGFLHGALSLEQVFVGRADQIWLTDLRTLGEGPPLWDFAQFETAVCLDGLAGASLRDANALCGLLLTAPGDSDAEPSLDLPDGTPWPEVEPPQPPLSPIVSWMFEWCRTIADHASAYASQSPYILGLLAAAAAQLGRFPVAQPDRPGRRELLRYGHALIRTLRCLQALDAARASPPPLTSFRHGLVVDEKAALVSVDGREVYLAPLRLRLVVFLFRNVGRVCHRDEIYRFVWDDTPDPAGDNRLTSLVDQVRQTFKKVSPRNYIHNRPGHGYWLNLEGSDDGGEP